MNEIVFGEGSVPVAVAARVYGKDASWVRTGIVVGWLPMILLAAQNKVRFEQCKHQAIRMHRLQKLLACLRAQ